MSRSPSPPSELTAGEAVEISASGGAPGGQAEIAAARDGARSSYGRGARVLSVGIATTGLVTFAYFSVASHVLDEVPYKRISLLWSVMFVIVSVIYRPIEQLLSRTIAQRRARGLEHGHPLRVPALIQGGFALAFAIAALALRGPIQDDVLDGSTALYAVLVVGVLAYAASYFARGWLAGHERFGLYGGLVLLESCSRFCFALAVALGIAHGQSAVAMGMAAAPFVSLVVVPWAFGRRHSRAVPTRGAVDAAGAPARGSAAARPAAQRAGDGATGNGAPGPRHAAPPGRGELSLAAGTGFALSVFVIMLAEQALLNAAVLTVDATSSNGALAGYVFNVLLIARAPLQLFQSVQTSLLPHLAGLHARAGAADFDRAVRLTVLVIAAFALLVAGALLVLGPWAMGVLFGSPFRYAAWGLALVGLGMGLHLTAGTLNQAALARGDARLAASAWALAGALFVGWLTLPVVPDELARVELGYFGATGLLSALLFALYRRPHPVAD